MSDCSMSESNKSRSFFKDMLWFGELGQPASLLGRSFVLSGTAFWRRLERRAAAGAALVTTNRGDEIARREAGKGDAGDLAAPAAPELVEGRFVASIPIPAGPAGRSLSRIVVGSVRATAFHRARLSP
jgi:hypothetical protein